MERLGRFRPRDYRPDVGRRFTRVVGCHNVLWLLCLNTNLLGDEAASPNKVIGLSNWVKQLGDLARYFNQRINTVCEQYREIISALAVAS